MMNEHGGRCRNFDTLLDEYVRLLLVQEFCRTLPPNMHDAVKDFIDYSLGEN